MKYKLLIIFLIGFPFFSKTQDYLTIQKILIDSINKNVICYASVSIAGTSIGTISDQDGSFILNIPEIFSNSIINVSALGYNVFKIKANDFVKYPEKMVLMTPHPILLHPVTISPDQLSASKILETAVKNVKKNYPLKPNLADAYYCEYIKEDQTYVRSMNAALSIYYDGSKPPVNPMNPLMWSDNSTYQVKVQEIKKVQENFKNLNRYPDANNLNLSFFTCNIYFFTHWIRNYKNFKLDSITFIGNETVYIIKSKDNDMIFYIGSDDFEFIKIIENYDIPEMKLFPFNFGSKISPLYMSFNKMNLNVDFIKINDFYYARFINYKTQVTYFGKDKKEKLFTISVNSTLLNNKYYFDNIKPIPKKERMDKFESLYEQKYEYNPNFWNNYNIVIDSTLNNKVNFDLNRTK
jgi:hypothetical protein